MNGLCRINLLVGSNNSGKTSLLEAIELLLSQGDPRSVWNSLYKRGERISDDEERRNVEFDVCRLFHNYNLSNGNKFEIISEGSPYHSQTLKVSSVELRDDDVADLELPLLPQDVMMGSTGLLVELLGSSGLVIEKAVLPLTERGGLSWETLRRRPIKREDQKIPVSFISTSSMHSDEVVTLLSRYVLNPEEDLVIEALRIIEKEIERIAPVSSSSSQSLVNVRGGVVVKLKNVNSRLPIGTMGDGIWRLLSLSLALARTKGGILLVDEIDTGLHYTVLESMWRLVFTTAIRSNIQIFATTHSSDCWKSLAAICRNPKFAHDASIQHIQKNASHSRTFSGREIIIAADRGFEVR
jgi:AAA15 family ATPase/GTPase